MGHVPYILVPSQQCDNFFTVSVPFFLSYLQGHFQVYMKDDCWWQGGSVNYVYDKRCLCFRPAAARRKPTQPSVSSPVSRSNNRYQSLRYGRQRRDTERAHKPIDRRKERKALFFRLIPRGKKGPQRFTQ